MVTTEIYLPTPTERTKALVQSFIRNSHVTGPFTLSEDGLIALAKQESLDFLDRNLLMIADISKDVFEELLSKINRLPLEIRRKSRFLELLEKTMNYYNKINAIFFESNFFDWYMNNRLVNIEKFHKSKETVERFQKLAKVFFKE